MRVGDEECSGGVSAPDMVGWGSPISVRVILGGSRGGNLVSRCSVGAVKESVVPDVEGLLPSAAKSFALIDSSLAKPLTSQP